MLPIHWLKVLIEFLAIQSQMKIKWSFSPPSLFSFENLLGISLLQTIWKPIHVLFNLSISFFFSVLQLCYLYLKWYRSLRKNNAKFTYFFMFTFVWKYKKYYISYYFSRDTNFRNVAIIYMLIDSQLYCMKETDVWKWWWEEAIAKIAELDKVRWHPHPPIQSIVVLMKSCIDI